MSGQAQSIALVPPLIGMPLNVAIQVATNSGLQFRIEENDGIKMKMDHTIKFNRVNFQVQDQVVIGYVFY